MPLDQTKIDQLIDDTTKAIQALTTGAQSYTITTPGGGSRQVTKASLTELQTGLDFWLKKRQELQNSQQGGNGVKYATFTRD